MSLEGVFKCLSEKNTSSSLHDFLYILSLSCIDDSGSQGYTMQFFSGLLYLKNRTNV
jgi:hypothetical protein